MTACTWDHPGDSRYTGTLAAAIAAYHLPAATQAALIDAFERRHFADVVVIDRDSIRGQHAEYSPQIERMHFGSHGRICDTVTRAGWAPEHVETALVACADGVCIAWPSVCGNVALISRVDRGAAPVAAVLGDLATAEESLAVGGPLDAGTAQPAVVLQPEPTSDGQGAYAPGSWGAVAGFGPAAYLTVTCASCEAPLAPAVPEPGIWSILAAGAALMSLRLRR